MKNLRSQCHILIVDDEPLIRESLFEIFRIDGYRVQMSSNAEDALKIIEENNIDIVVTDLKLPKMDGLGLLKQVREKSSSTEVIVITGYGSIESAVDAMKIGAFDYITKPINDNEIKIVIEKIVEKKKLLEENAELKKIVAEGKRSSFCGMIGSSVKMQKVYSTIDAVASTNATILITGDSGTGKGLIARAIHERDVNRKNKPFIEISCGALSETLLESELFGHVKGAFTGAIKDKEGRFEYAKGGTIFLDEIDTFTLPLQVKLLRVLQDGVFERVGDNVTRKAAARIVVATNQNLPDLIESGDFREDLYYRINVIAIEPPSLKERSEDLPSLINHFLSIYNHVNGKKIKQFSKEVVDIFQSYHWPGNIRELENAVEGAVIMCQTTEVQPDDVPNIDKFHHGSVENKKGNGSGSVSARSRKASLKKAVEEPEKEHILDVLDECDWNRNKAAKSLGINRTTLYNKMKKYKITHADRE